MWTKHKMTVLEATTFGRQCVNVAHVHVFMLSMMRYLSHLLDAVGEDVSDDDPLLRRGPQVHLYQDDVVE